MGVHVKLQIKHAHSNQMFVVDWGKNPQDYESKEDVRVHLDERLRSWQGGQQQGMFLAPGEGNEEPSQLTPRQISVAMLTFLKSSNVEALQQAVDARGMGSGLHLTLFADKPGYAELQALFLMTGDTIEEAALTPSARSGKRKSSSTTALAETTEPVMGKSRTEGPSKFGLINQMYDPIINGAILEAILNFFPLLRRLEDEGIEAVSLSSRKDDMPAIGNWLFDTAAGYVGIIMCLDYPKSVRDAVGLVFTSANLDAVRVAAMKMRAHTTKASSGNPFMMHEHECFLNRGRETMPLLCAAFEKVAGGPGWMHKQLDQLIKDGYAQRIASGGKRLKKGEKPGYDMLLSRMHWDLGLVCSTGLVQRKGREPVSLADISDEDLLEEWGLAVWHWCCSFGVFSFRRLLGCRLW